MSDILPSPDSSFSSDEAKRPRAFPLPSPAGSEGVVEGTFEGRREEEGGLPRPPRAQKRYGYRVRDIHGEHVDDPWDWLRDQDSEEVLAHVRAENAWADEVCAPTQKFASRLVEEFRSHTTLTDVSVPVRHGNWWYFHRWEEGLSYPTHHRVPVTGEEPAPFLAPGVPHPGEQLLVDENVWAQEQEFFRLTGLTPSPTGRWIAWARDLAGDERWTWVIQDADTGEIVDEQVMDAGYGVAWSADSSSVIYTRVDDAWRQFQLWLHRVGTSAQEDVLLLEEADEGFDLWFSPSNDPEHVIIHSTSTTTGEAWLWLPHLPEAAPIPLTGRRDGVMVGVEPAGDHLLIVHTASSPEGTLAVAPLDATAISDVLGHRALNALPPLPAAGSFGDGLGSSAADAHVALPIAPESTWIPIREAEPGERILDVEAYRDFCVLSLRSASLSQVEYRLREVPFRGTRTAVEMSAPMLSAEECARVWGSGRRVDVVSPVRTIMPVPAGRFDDPLLRVEHQSVTVPPTVEEIHVHTGERRVLKTLEVPGWDPSQYREERVWVRARDGHTDIPVTLVRRCDVQPDGSNPGWLHGYGSYEVSFDAEFDVLRLPALARGVVHAIAHVRGGGEMGRAWYEDGKKRVKTHTFTDFVDVADELISSGWVADSRLIAEGRSAGGLLMGAVTNMAPQRFRAILAGVPFVDALTTILDPSLPLTVGEWEEWGNPIEDAEIYRLMRNYTPYENVVDGVRYPAVMATTSLNDTRVFFAEPLKWVQRLREATASDSRERPVLVRTEMVAGHGGRSGREGRWEARAEEFAFVLGQVGVCE